MTSRGRFNQSNEWESRDEYNSSVYDPQYADNDSGEGVNLDHARLYIKSIPKGLNEEGLRAAFSKFGTLVEVFLSKDPEKHYALVKYETPGEAKLAMMKMNRTEPLRLQINIAHKRKNIQSNTDWQERNSKVGPTRERSDRNLGMSNRDRDRDDNASVASRGRSSRVQDDIPNGDNNMDEMMMDDDYGFSDILDPNLHLELENLKLEQLKVREEQLQCKQRVILLKQAERKPMAPMSNRCILPDGKIVVRNIESRDSRDADVSYSAGAGDSLKLPGLQRVAVRLCVVCGGASDAFCAGCGITPYCSEPCQRRDWQNRHRAVCHNLARLNSENVRAATAVQEIAEIEPKVPTIMPLRRPHVNTPNNKRDLQSRDDSSETRNSNGGFTSRSSQKSYGSNGKEDQSSNSQERQRKPYQNRNFNQKKDYQPVETTTPVSPRKEEPTRQRNTFNRPQAPATKPEVVEEPKKAEPARQAAPPARQRSLVPKFYLFERMSVGDSIIMSVDAKASDSRISRGDFVCLTMAEALELDYNSLCEDFVLDCNKDEQPVKLIPGETISYFNPEDCGWYRARCLNPTTLALLDSSKIVSVSATDKFRKLPSKYEAIPEFSAVLASKAVELGASLNCKILAQTPNGYKVSMADVETNKNIGEAEVFRWIPTVEYQVAPINIPEVARPPLTNGTKVFLVLADSLDKVFVRPADSESQRKYNDVLQQVLLSAIKAKPLTEPPSPGQTVIGKFVDDCFYRALVKRINVKMNKYQIEYAEYGNIEVSTLDNLYPCPAEFDLSSVQTQVSVLKLAPATDLSAAAKELIKELMQDEELVLSLPEGRQSAPSGSEASLTIVKNRTDVGSQLTEMCTPNWKKIEKNGGDVVETETIMFPDIEYTELPATGCTIEVLDISVLKGGAICGYDRLDPKADAVFNDLTGKMADYCNSELGREPYLPKAEELCIAQLPPYPQWFRAVFIDLVAGPGSKEAKICYLDYGNIATVPVTLIRKMMPDFIRGIPVMGLYLEIRDFPKEADDAVLSLAVVHMNIDAEGRGGLRVSRCDKQADGVYVVDAPALLAAMAP